MFVYDTVMLVVKTRSAAVPSLITLIFAPGVTAPELSVTVPVNPAEVRLGQRRRASRREEQKTEDST
jgi:hypothetical protein